MLLLELGHVDGGEEALTAIKQIRQGQCGFGFTDAAGADQQEYADRRIGAVEASGGGAHRAVQRSDGLLLAAYSLAKVAGEGQHLAVVLAGQLAQRHAGPVADHFGHQARADFETDQAFIHLSAGQLGLHGAQFAFQLLQLYGLAVTVLGFGRVLAQAGALLAQFQQAFGQLALHRPTGFDLLQFGAGLAQACFELFEDFAVDFQAGFHIAAHGLALPLTLSNLATQALQRFWCCGQADTYTGAGCVEDIDGFIRQLAASQIARGQLGSSNHGVITQVDTVAFLVNRRQATQDGYGFIDGRLMQLHRLEAAGQGWVLLEVLLVFAPGGGGDGAQLTTRQGGLEQVGRITTAGLAAGTD